MVKLAIGLGIGTAAAAVFAVPPTLPWHMIGLSGPGYVAILVFAALAIAGGLSAKGPLITVAGAGLLAAAVFELSELVAGGQNTLGGDLSTVALFLGLGVAFTLIGLVQSGALAVKPRV